MITENVSTDQTEIEIDQIEIGDRFRKKLGDIDALAKSIEEVGLLHPVVLKRDGQLVAGFRRIEAYKQLKRDTIPCTRVDTVDSALLRLQAEQDENTCRENLARSEQLALAEAIKEIEAPKAKQRQRDAGGDKTAPSSQEALPKNNGKRSSSERHANETDAKAAKAAGTSADTLRKTETVVTAAKEDPEQFGEIKEEMDRTGKVDPAYKKVKAKKDPVGDRERQVTDLLRHMNQTKAKVLSIKWDAELVYSSEVHEVLNLCNFVVAYFQDRRKEFPKPKPEDTSEFLGELEAV